MRLYFGPSDMDASSHANKSKRPNERMDALEKALRTPEVSGPLSWGVACASAATIHAYASLFAAVPRPKTRVLRSLDVGVVIFAISSTLAYYNQPRPEE